MNFLSITLSYCFFHDELYERNIIFMQSNETGSSNATELEGAKRCFNSLHLQNVRVDTFISDRHKSIAKWIRDCQKDTKHFFDIWHIARSITKKMLKAGREKGFQIITEWIAGVRNHLYWAASTTKAGFEDMIEAKWTSFMRHVAGKHDSHPNALFQKCLHDELEPRKWIRIGKYFSKFDILHGSISKLNFCTGINQIIVMWGMSIPIL